MINPFQMEVIVSSGETEIAFSETEMEAAEQLVQLSEDDTMSCSSGTGWSFCEGGGNTRRQEDVVSSEIHDMAGTAQNDGVRMVNKNITDERSFVKAKMGTKTIMRDKKHKFRSLASIYRATKEMARD